MFSIKRYIDTHCHLDAIESDDEKKQIIAEAKNAGVEKFIVPGVDLNNWKKLSALARQFPNAYLAPGIHPLFLEELVLARSIALLEKQLEEPKVIAIGEVGLDIYHSKENLDMQLAFFKAQTELAISAKLPLLLHVRKAHDTILSILRKRQYAQKGCGGVVHAYSGSLQQAQQYYEMGFLLGIGGMICNPRARKKQTIVAQMPINALVLETDAPYMNIYPRALPAILQSIAELREEDPVYIARAILKNTLSLFFPNS